MLADIYSNNGQTAIALQHLIQVGEIAMLDENKAAEAEGALKLGLLYNKEGAERNPKLSADYLGTHFDLLRSTDVTQQNLLDAGRVNLGIVQANMKIEQYKNMVLGNLQGLVDWKVRREHKHFHWTTWFVKELELVDLNDCWFYDLSKRGEQHSTTNDSLWAKIYGNELISNEEPH